MWKSRAGHAAENPGQWPSERRGKGEARTALLEGPKPARGSPPSEPLARDAKQTVCAQSGEPPYTDPYVRWCGRGGAARLPPIPIMLVLEKDDPELYTKIQ